MLKSMFMKMQSQHTAKMSEDEREEYVQSAKLLMKQQGINLVSKKR